MIRRLARLLGGLLALCALPAAAEGNLLLVDPAPERQATLSLGASGFAFPAYPGGAQRSGLLIPAFEWMHPSGAFLSTDIGAGWNLSRRSDLQYGARLWPILSRTPTDGSRLRELPGIPLRLEKTLFANWAPVDFAQLQSSLNTGYGADGRGTLIEAGVSAGAPLGSHLLLGLTIGISYANSDWRQSYFGVPAGVTTASSAAPSGGTPAAAVPSTPGAPGRGFLAGAGWQDAQLSAGLEWTFEPRWRLVGRLDNWRLLGAAAASPLTESRWQHSLILTVWHDLQD